MGLKVVLIGQGGVIITGVPVYNDRNLRATCKGEMVFLHHLEEGGLSRPKQCYQSPNLSSLVITHDLFWRYYSTKCQYVP